MSESVTDDSETPINNNLSSEDEYESEIDSDYGAVQVNMGDTASILAPYEDEPLLLTQDEIEQEHEVDIDGIRISALQERFDNAIPTNEWCSCNMCDTSSLNGTREHRCCAEIDKAVEKFGHLENIACITQLEDYQSLTKTVVLEHIGPLLKDRQGRTYKQRSDQGRNIYLRAVAYRWTIRYIFGFLGWDNTRPLPACVYHDIRTRFPTSQSTGYLSTNERS